MTSMYPAEKLIQTGGGDLKISVDFNGWPRWTRITKGNGEYIAVLNEDAARDLHYALTRIVGFLDDARQLDRLRGVQA